MTFEERIQSLHKERTAYEHEIRRVYLEEYERTRLERTLKAYELLKSEGVKIVKPGWMRDKLE